MSDILKWASPDGHFRRQVSKFRDTIAPEGKFPPAANRYHLYVSLACPWAHRCLVVRALKGLQAIISLSVVDYLMLDEGWKFSEPQETEGCIPDPVFGAKYLREVYLATTPDYQGRYTVPVLLDKQTKQIVNNESAEILRILNTSFNQWATNPTLDLTPKHLLPQIDEANEWIYDQINNGVYKAGFATKQEAYEEAARKVNAGLRRCNELLASQPYILGDTLTETDIRLFTSVLRY